MITLFIDTSFSDVSIALIKDKKLLSLIHEDIPNKHSVYTVEFISNIIKNNNLKVEDINEIIVVNGPGSFTGIRIGVTIAKTFAYLRNIKIKEITSLLARALSTSSSTYILSLVDAMHDNYYLGLYDKDYNKIKEEFASKEEILSIIKEYNPKIVTEKDYYNIEKIVEYMEKVSSVNPHSVNPIYLKKPSAMEK